MQHFQDNPKPRCQRCGSTGMSPVQSLPSSPVPHLATSNALPTASDTEQIQKFIATLHGDIEQLDEDMAHMNKTLEEMQTRRWALNDISNQHKDLLKSTPASRIYPELWSEIFLRCQHGSVHKIFPEVPDSFDPKEGPLLLTQVCRGWRTVALSTPQLWTTFRVRIGRKYHYSSQVALILTWVSRSGVCPFTVCIVDANAVSPLPALESDPAVHAMVSTIRRWRDFHLIISPFNNPWPLFASIKNKVAHLRNISVISTDTMFPCLYRNNPPHYNQPLRLFEHAAQIKSFWLDCAIPLDLITIPSNTLAVLNLYTRLPTHSASINECLEALNRFPTLIECHMHCGFVDDIGALRHIDNPRLKTFTVRATRSVEGSLGSGLGGLFEHLTFSNLQELTLESLGVNRVWDYSAFFNFLSRCTRLESLALRCEGISRNGLLEYFDLTPTLKTLKLDPGVWYCEEVLNDLTSKKGLPCLLPQLEHVEFGGDLMIDDEVFLTFLKSRKMPHALITRLRSAHINCATVQRSFFNPRLINELDNLLEEGMSVRIEVSQVQHYPLI